MSMRLISTPEQNKKPSKELPAQDINHELVTEDEPFARPLIETDNFPAEKHGENLYEFLRSNLSKPKMALVYIAMIRSVNEGINELKLELETETLDEEIEIAISAFHRNHRARTAFNDLYKENI